MACRIVNPQGERTWYDLVPMVKPHVIGAPEPVIANAIELAAIDFCRRTEALKRFFHIDMQKNVHDYYLELEDCSTPIRITKVKLKDWYEFSPQWGGALSRGGPWSGCYGGYRFASESPTHVHVSQSDKDQENGLEVTLVIAPKLGGCRMDDFLFDQWAQALIYGALQKLHGMMGKSTKLSTWYSPAEEA